MFSMNNNCLMHCSSPEIQFERYPDDSHVSQRVIAVLMDKWGSFDWYPLQNHVLPVLSELYNMVVIGEAKSGKTLSSVIAVVSSIIRQLHLDLFVPKTYGPKVIHLCSYSSDVRQVNEMYTTLLDAPDPDNVVSMACGAMSLETAKAVIEGCDILITTPPCLVRILESIQNTELTRLRHIVFDDADVTFSIFPNEVETIMKIGLAEREIQMILLSKKWNEKLKVFVENFMYNGVVYISSMHQHESIFYSESKINFEFFKPGHKTECLRALLMDIDTYQRTVIFCKSSHEILYLQEELGDIPAINLLVVHDGMSVPEVSEVGEDWRNSSHNPVLLCTDGLVFSELRLTNCTRLIHYSLPTQNDNFSLRFGCLMRSYRNIFLSEEENKEAPRIDILIDKTNDEPSPMIVNLMNRLKVHPVMDEVEKCIVRRKDISRKHAPVCDLLCKFGVCMEQKNACLQRHIFIKCVDDVDDHEKLLRIPDGVVKIIIQNVHSATHFSASIVALKVGEKWAETPNFQFCTKLITMKMRAHFSGVKNRCWLPTREVGDIVAVEPRPDCLRGLYCRARVISVLSETRVKVKLIDVGGIMEFDVYKLFDLPDNLKEYPHLTVDMFLSGLKPPARDCDWPNNAVQFSKIWVERAMNNFRISGKNFIFGEIEMKVGHCLWMANLKYCGWGEQSNAIESSLGFELITRQLAEHNPDHKTRLTNLMEIAGISEQEAGAATEIGERWAELPKETFSTVEVISAQNPHCLYLRQKNLADRLDLLTADIQHFAEKSEHVKKGTLSVGSICLALSNNIWRRAKIYKISSDLQILEVFFVDEGSSGWVEWDEVLEIPQNFITRLPFQAIECELAGLEEPEQGGWSMTVESAIFEITNFKAFKKALQAYVTHEKDAKMGGRKYSIILIDTNTSPNIVVNRALLNWGFAERQPLVQEIDEIVCQLKASSLEEEAEDISASSLSSASSLEDISL